jgi:hypothetical protein
MTKQLLYYPEIRTSIQKVCGKAVTQQVGMDWNLASPLQQAVDLPGSQSPTSDPQEQRLPASLVNSIRTSNCYKSRPSLVDPTPEGFLARWKEWEVPLAQSLAPDSHHAHLQIHGGQIQTAEFPDAQTCVVEKLHYRQVSQLNRIASRVSPDWAEHLLHFCLLERAWQPRGSTPDLHIQAWI